MVLSGTQKANPQGGGLQVPARELLDPVSVSMESLSIGTYGSVLILDYEG